MIIEGILATTNADESMHIAPMGPKVDRQLTDWTLRPFQSSHTYANLKRSGQAVFHVVDDVMLLARAAIHAWEQPPAHRPAEAVQGWILESACRWYELEVVQFDDREPRCEVRCQVVQQGKLRDFFGFNRAKHAVVEAAILATRTHLIERRELLSQLDQLQVIVEKTCGQQEEIAFTLLSDHIRSQVQDPNNSATNG